MNSINPCIKYIFILAHISLILCCTSSHVPTQQSREQALQKITFDTSKIDENGLIGPPDGQVSIAYKFQIPVDRRKQKEIKKIDSSIRFFKRPGDDTYMCIGEGATKNVLIKLASLPYIIRIDRFYGE